MLGRLTSCSASSQAWAQQLADRHLAAVDGVLEAVAAAHAVRGRDGLHRARPDTLRTTTKTFRRASRSGTNRPAASLTPCPASRRRHQSLYSRAVTMTADELRSAAETEEIDTVIVAFTVTTAAQRR